MPPDDIETPSSIKTPSSTPSETPEEKSARETTEAKAKEREEADRIAETELHEMQASLGIVSKEVASQKDPLFETVRIFPKLLEYAGKKDEKPISDYLTGIFNLVQKDDSFTQIQRRNEGAIGTGKAFVVDKVNNTAANVQDLFHGDFMKGFNRNVWGSGGEKETNASERFARALGVPFEVLLKNDAVTDRIKYISDILSKANPEALKPQGRKTVAIDEKGAVNRIEGKPVDEKELKATQDDAKSIPIAYQGTALGTAWMTGRINGTIREDFNSWRVNKSDETTIQRIWYQVKGFALSIFRSMGVTEENLEDDSSLKGIAEFIGLGALVKNPHLGDLEEKKKGGLEVQDPTKISPVEAQERKTLKEMIRSEIEDPDGKRRLTIGGDFEKEIDQLDDLDHFSDNDVYDLKIILDTYLGRKDTVLGIALANSKITLHDMIFLYRQCKFENKIQEKPNDKGEALFKVGDGYKPVNLTSTKDGEESITKHAGSVRGFVSGFDEKIEKEIKEEEAMRTQVSKVYPKARCEFSHDGDFLLISPESGKESKKIKAIKLAKAGEKWTILSLGGGFFSSHLEAASVGALFARELQFIDSIDARDNPYKIDGDWIDAKQTGLSSYFNDRDVVKTNDLDGIDPKKVVECLNDFVHHYRLIGVSTTAPVLPPSSGGDSKPYIPPTSSMPYNPTAR